MTVSIKSRSARLRMEGRRRHGIERTSVPACVRDEVNPSPWIHSTLMPSVCWQATWSSPAERGISLNRQKKNPTRVQRQPSSAIACRSGNCVQVRQLRQTVSRVGPYPFYRKTAVIAVVNFGHLRKPAEHCGVPQCEPRNPTLELTALRQFFDQANTLLRSCLFNGGSGSSSAGASGRGRKTVCKIYFAGTRADSEGGNVRRLTDQCSMRCRCGLRSGGSQMRRYPTANRPFS